MIDRLNQDFVNVWIVREELDRIVRMTDVDPAVRDLARMVVDDYKYPVDSQLRATDGKLLRQVAVNDLMRKDMNAEYLAFLAQVDK